MVKKTTDAIPQVEINLPDKKYFTIGEVSDICDLKSHVLRYWEQVFPQLQPSKRRGRRYYQRRDLELVIEIKSLLQDQGFTIQGAKAKLGRLSKEGGEPASPAQADLLEKLQSIRKELHEFQAYFAQRF